MQVVAVRGLDGDLRFGQAQLQQVGLGVFRVDEARIPQVLAGALHLHQQNRADVAVGLSQQARGFGVQGIKLLHAGRHATLPVGPAPHVHMDGQLDHLRLVQVGTAHVHQNVGAAALVGTHARRGRQLQHEAGVETIDGLQRVLGVGVVAFVYDHHRPQQAHHIAERAFHDATPGGARLGLAGAPRRVGIQVGHLAQQLPVRLYVIVPRQVTQHVAPVAEETQRLLALPRGRRQHQQHHTQVRVGVQAGQRRILFQNLDAARTRHIEHLVVGVVAVLERLERLPVDGLVGHNPQHQAGVARQVGGKNMAHAGRCQQGLAATGRDLETHIGNGAPGTVKAAGMGLAGKGRWQMPRGLEHGPCLLGEVRCPAHHAFHALHRAQRGCRSLVLQCVLFQLGKV